MTYQPLSAHSRTDPYLQGFWNDEFCHVQRTLENHDSHPSYHGHTFPQNFSSNSHAPLSEVVPRFHVPQKKYHALLHADVPCAYRKDPWSNGYSQTLLDGSHRFLDNSVHSWYNACNSSRVSNAAYFSFQQQVDHEHASDHFPGVNHQCSDSGFADCQHTPPLSQPYRYSTNILGNKEFINRSAGDCFPLPYSHSIGEIIRGTETPPGRRTSRAEDMFDVHSSSPYHRRAQSAVFDHSSFALQPYVSHQNFSPNFGMMSCGGVGVTDYGSVNFSAGCAKEFGCGETLTPVRSFSDPERTAGSNGFDVSGGFAYTDRNSASVASSSPAMKKASDEDVVSTDTALSRFHFTPQTGDKSVLLAPTINAANWDGMMVDSVSHGRQASDCFMRQQSAHVNTGIVSGGSGYRMCGHLPAKDEQVGSHLRETETGVMSTEVSTFGVGTYCRNWEASRHGGCENNGGTSAVTTASEVSLEANMMHKYSSSCRDMPTECKDTDSYGAATSDSATIIDCSDKDDDDDVIIVSMSPIALQNDVPCSRNAAVSSAVTSCGTTAQTASGHNSLKNNVSSTFSDCCSLVPNSVPSTFSNVNANTFASRSRFSPSVPFLVHDVSSRSGNCGNSRSHAKHIVANGCRMQGCSCSSSVGKHSTSHLPMMSRTVTPAGVNQSHCSPFVPMNSQEWFQQSAPSELQRLTHPTTPVDISANPGKSLLGTCSSQTIESDHHYACATKRSFASRSASEISNSTSASRVLRNATMTARNQAVKSSHTVNRDHQYAYLPSFQCSIPQQSIKRHSVYARSASEVGSSAFHCSTPRQIPKQLFISGGSAEENGRSVPASRVVRGSTMAARNNRAANFNHHCQKHGLPTYRRVSSVAQVDNMSVRKHGTFSLPAAHQMLQKMRQRKLLDFMYVRGARQLPVDQRCYPPFRRTVSNDQSVIDLTADDDDAAVAETSCESMFARVRYHDAGRRLRRYMQWKWIGKTRLMCGTSSSAAQCHANGSFPVNKSLPFYRCFVQKLLRNYRIGRSFVSRLPARISPELPPSIYFASKASRSVAKACKDVASTTQPVVVLERLDHSVLEQISMGKAIIVQSNTNPVDGSHSKNCISAAANPSIDGCYTLQLSDGRETPQSCETEDQTSLKLADVLVDGADKESAKKEHEGVKTLANEELLSLCCPLSVILQRWDGSKPRQTDSGEDANETQPENNLTSAQLPVEPTGWSVTRIPCSGDVPILVIRMSVLKVPVVDGSHQKAAENRYSRPGPSDRLLRSSAFKSPMKRRLSHPPEKLVGHLSPQHTEKCKILQKAALKNTAWYRQLNLNFKPNLRKAPTKPRLAQGAEKLVGHSSPQRSERYKMLQKRALKKAAKHRKLNLIRPVLPNLRSKRYTNRSRRRAGVGVPTCRPLCEVHSKRSHPIPSKLLPVRCSKRKERQPVLTEVTHRMPSRTIRVDQDVPIVPSELTLENSAPIDLPTHDSGIGEDLADDGDTSDSNTICGSPPRSLTDDDATIKHRSPLGADFDDDKSTQDLLEWSEVGTAADSIDNMDSLELKPASPSDCHISNCGGRTTSQPTDVHDAHTTAADVRPVEFPSVQVDTCSRSDHFLSDLILRDPMDEGLTSRRLDTCVDVEMEGATSVIDFLSELAEAALKECDMDSVGCDKTREEDSGVGTQDSDAGQEVAAIMDHSVGKADDETVHVQSTGIEFDGEDVDKSAAWFCSVSV